MKLHTKSRDGLYEANAIFENNVVVVLKGSRINARNSKGYKPSEKIANIRSDSDIVDSQGYLLKDVAFETLSTAATFVTGRTANGMIVWKTEDGKYVRFSIQKG